MYQLTIAFHNFANAFKNLPVTAKAKFFKAKIQHHTSEYMQHTTTTTTTTTNNNNNVL
jgi:hypothetical protein